MTYLLEAIAILVGLAGVAATFSAQTLARTKEFGMLRHLGVTRRQIIAMLLMEGALLGAVGVIAGIGLGLAMSQVLIHVVNPQSFNWTMETRLALRAVRDRDGGADRPRPPRRHCSPDGARCRSTRCAR